MTESLATRDSTTLARPDWLANIPKGDVRGTENIGVNDIKFPALRLAQATSPEVKRSEAAYVEGLREGEIFNSNSKENYGENPVEFIIVNQLGHRNMEFDPSDRTIVLDGNVPDNDPRCEFTEEIVDGVRKRIKPRATKFYDYLILLRRPDRPLALMTFSLKSTQLKKAKVLNEGLKTAGLPSFAHLIKATPAPEHKGANSWYGWQFSLSWPTETEYQFASNYYDALSNKKVIVEAEVDVVKDDDISF